MQPCRCPDCGLAPNFGRYALPSLCEQHSRVEFCPTYIPLPSWSVALPVVHADRVPCDTVRLQVELPNALRALEEVHRHFSLSICYVDRRKLGREKDGYMRRKAQFRCTRHAGRGRESITGPRSGNGVSHPRLEKSASQEICGNSYRGRKGVFGSCYREESPLASASCERFLNINRTVFGLRRVGYNDAYLRDFMFESCEISLRRQGQNRDNR